MSGRTNLPFPVCSIRSAPVLPSQSHKLEAAGERAALGSSNRHTAGGKPSLSDRLLAASRTPCAAEKAVEGPCTSRSCTQEPRCIALHAWEGLHAARLAAPEVAQGLNWEALVLEKLFELGRPSNARLCRPDGRGEDWRGTFGVLVTGECLQMLAPVRPGPLSVIVQAGGRAGKWQRRARGRAAACDGGGWRPHGCRRSALHTAVCACAGRGSALLQR